MTHTNRKTNDVESCTGDGWEMRRGKWQESPPEEVDHVISDPPFDEHTHENGRIGDLDKGISVPHEKTFDAAYPRDFAPRLLNIARRWVLCFCAVEQFGAYRWAAGDDAYMRSGVWVKPNPAPQFTGDRPGQWGEGIAIMHSRERDADGNLAEALRWNGGGRRGLWRFQRQTGVPSEGQDRLHETQKPLPLMIALTEDFTDPGDLVWDPYAGSATTGVACTLTGRRFIGHEMQERYFEVACERLEAESKGLKLSDAQAGQRSLLEVAE